MESVLSIAYIAPTLNQKDRHVGEMSCFRKFLFLLGAKLTPDSNLKTQKKLL